MEVCGRGGEEEERAPRPRRVNGGKLNVLHESVNCMMAEIFVLFYLLTYFKYPEHCLTLFSKWHKWMNARSHICLKGQPQPMLGRSLTDQNIWWLF